jgi:hypothetical protein
MKTKNIRNLKELDHTFIYFNSNFEIFMVLKIWTVFIWVMTPCSHVGGYQWFGEIDVSIFWVETSLTNTLEEHATLDEWCVVITNLQYVTCFISIPSGDWIYETKINVNASRLIEGVNSFSKTPITTYNTIWCHNSTGPLPKSLVTLFQ